MDNLFIHQTPPEDQAGLNAYLDRTLRDIASNIETIADGRAIEKRHVEPLKPRDGMVVYADGTNWNPGSGEGFYERIAGVWVARTDGTVLETLFNANTILKADTDDTPAALTVPVQTLVGRITAGVITALTPAQVRTLINVEDGSAADQTDAEIKTAYENNTDTNEFSDAEQTKLADVANSIVQVVVNEDATYQTGTSTTIPFDNTIPTTSEGQTFTSHNTTITPTASANDLLIEAQFSFMTSGTNVFLNCAMFKDAGTNAIATSGEQAGSPAAPHSLHLTHKINAGSTSAQTFKFYFGANTATTFSFNGTNTVRVFGGVNKCVIKITEIKP